jgi:hypothetical protein
MKVEERKAIRREVASHPSPAKTQKKNQDLANV